VTGENNTVSNIGGGVSLYKQKVDIDLEFKTLNSTTAHITIVDDTGNNEVDVVFDQTQITGTNTLVAGSIDTGFGVINTNNSITGADADFTSLTVDNLVLNNNSITATGNVSIIPTGEILLKENPISALGAATKQYVDSISSGLIVKEAARATSASLPAYIQSGAGVGATLTSTSNGTLTVDGINLIFGDRALIKSEGTSNGVYNITQVGDGSNPWILTRSTDFDSVDSGFYVLITEGTTFGGSSWIVSTPDPIIVDTTVIEFSQFSSAASSSITNIGTGIGLFKQKIGNDFEFRNINTSSNKISAVLNGVNDDVDIDLVQANITGTGIVTTGSIDTGFGVINTNNSITGSTLNSTTVTTNQLNLVDITYTGTTGNNKIILPFNLSNAFDINDGTNNYISIASDIPTIKLLQNTNVTGTLTTTGVVNGRNMTTDGTDLDSIMLTGISDMTAAEVNQLENINAVTISNTQWGYLGALDQALATTDVVNFAQLTVDQISMNNNVITANNLEINDDSNDYIHINSTVPSIELLQHIVIADNSEPNNPADGFGAMYKKTGNDGLFWKPDSSGVEVDLTTAPQYVRTPTTISYAVLATDEIIGVDTTNNAVSITLPQISTIGGTTNYRKYYIVDEGGNANVNNITLATTGGDTINKNASPLLIDVEHTSITLYNNGVSNWIIL
jgi:hypothetical protein